MVLPQLFDVLARQRVGDLDVDRVGELLQLGHGRLRRDLAPDGGAERVVHAQAVPRAAEVVLGAVGPRHDVRPRDGDGRVLDHLLREVGHLVVVAVRLVGLEHRELGAVGRVGALVAEVAVDLEHALDAPDDGTLEEQLGRDAQEQLHVEGVRVGDEGASGCSAVHRLQHGCLDLEVAVLGERRPQARDGGGAGAHRAPRLVAHDEVEVALAHARLLIEVFVQGRQGQDRLRGDRPARHHDAQLAAAACDDLARDVHVVAEVDELLPPVEALLADDGEAQHDLQPLPVARLQRREAQLAGVAREHDAAREGDVLARGDVGVELAMARAHCRDRIGDLETDRVRVQAGREHPRPLVEAHLLLLGDLLDRRLGALGARGVARRSGGLAHLLVSSCTAAQA